MREIVLDTETTGLNPLQGDKLVEIGGVELINHLPTGNIYHQYINPDRDMPAEAEAIHGLSGAFLQDKPYFADIASEFVEFIADAHLIIHNAAFDTAFLNAELALVNRPPIDDARVIDTLGLAKRKFPSGPNSLDALCRRFGIDNSRREKHGALLDSELLAEVYLELIGGRQTTLVLADDTAEAAAASARSAGPAKKRPNPLPARLTPQDIEAHKAFIAELGTGAIWLKHH